MIHIIAYIFEADVHCIECTQSRFAHTPQNGFWWTEHNNNPVLRRSFGRPGAFTSYDGNGNATQLDEHLIPEYAVDREGNRINPVFSTDERDFTHCGECGQPL